MIQNFGGGEIIVIIIVALVVLGPDRLPEMARGAGRMLHKFRTMTSGLQGQVRDVMDDPAMKPLKELGEFAARPRQKLSEYALEAEADERAKAEKESLDAADATAASTNGTSTNGTSSDTTVPQDPPADDTTRQPSTTPATPVWAVAEPSAHPDDLVADSGAPTPPTTPAPAPAPADPAPVVAAEAATTDAVDPTERESA